MTHRRKDEVIEAITKRIQQMAWLRIDKNGLPYLGNPEELAREAIDASGLPLSLVGSRIRVQKYTMGHPTHTDDYTIELFRHCPGIFLSSADRQAGNFTPLCELYEPGPDSEKKYISNYGNYFTNEVQSWMDIPQPPQQDVSNE